MGLFDKLKRDKQTVSDTSCPYCNMLLGSMPQRKMKCPSCGQYIFVRTRPSDRQRILVTEHGSKAIYDELAKIKEKKITEIRAEIVAANTAALHRYKEKGITHVEIYPAANACSVCNTWAGVYPIARAPLLPIPVCTNPMGCRCTYLPVID